MTVTACVATAGFVADSSDCDDLDPSVHPDALEQCDGVDNNCDEVVDGDALDATIWYDDLDGDGYGDDLSVPVEACESPTVRRASRAIVTTRTPRSTLVRRRSVTGSTTTAMVTWMTRSRGSRRTTWMLTATATATPQSLVSACDAPDGMVEYGDDCDDDDDSVHPSALETCDDVVDKNCDGFVGATDEDGDGFSACEECDDANPDVTPDALRDVRRD